MKTAVCACALSLALAAAARADVQKEAPVGLVLSAGGGKLLRAGTETAIAARPGDVLFVGDAVRAEGAPSSFLFCPGKTSQTLGAGGEVRLEARQLKVKTGNLTDQKTVGACLLPQVVRLAVASQQHYGVTMTRGGPAELPPPVPADRLPPEVQAELAPLDKELAAAPRDMSLVLGRAAVFEKYKLLANALAEYKKVGGEWKDAVWVKRQIFDLQESLSAAASEAAAKAPEGGRTFALVAGISKYQKLPQDLWLQYANADASEFAKYLATPRGGALPPENIMLLTDDKATTAALRTAFQTFLKARAGKKDTVFVLIAGHGTVETTGAKGAYILTYDSDPQDLASTALPMADVQSLMDEQLSKVGRVAVFVDVCHSGTIGAIKSTAINGAVEKLGDAEGEILGLMASRPKELSYEGPEFGGGHGAFTYYLLIGLSGDADKNNDGIVNANELIAYVRDKVAGATSDKQHPRDFGTMDNAVVLSDKSKPGIQITRRSPVFIDSRARKVYLASLVPMLAPEQTPGLERFRSALQAGRLLPGEPGNAFDELSSLDGALTPEQYLLRANELRVALEDLSQQVLLRYMAGEQVPQTRATFAAAARYMGAAAQLTPESLFLEGRRDFFQGRTLLFDRNYPEAADLLERSVAIDPGGAYAYNALGIAYLEQADYKRAAAAFRDAVRRAPHWAYPLHNLALVYIQTGDYAPAIRAYQDAMRLSPDAAYLPYNLGLVYQRTNRRAEADAAYRKAMSLAPDKPESYNALGSLKASTGKSAEAEPLYRKALERDPAFLPARHNLALLLRGTKSRREEARSLWRENLTRAPDYVPSRLSLAEALAEDGESAGAVQEYRTLLGQRPEYVAARLALAGLLLKTGDPGAAVEQFQAALRGEADNATLWERLGDAQKAAGRAADAARSYQGALERAQDNASRKRLRAKLQTQ
jgi:tetratricopeptide (TPR) repeat protein